MKHFWFSSTHGRQLATGLIAAAMFALPSLALAQSAHEVITYHKFNQFGGTVSTDMSANTNDGYLVSGAHVMLASGGPTLPGTAQNLGYLTHVSNVGVTILDSPTMDWDKSAGTVVLWARLPSFSSYQFGTQILSESTGNVEIKSNSGGRVWFKTTNTGGTTNYIDGGSTPNNQNWAASYRLYPSLGQTPPLNPSQFVWSHLAFVWDEDDNGLMQIYHNGVLLDLANGRGIPADTNVAGSRSAGGRDRHSIDPNGTGWTSDVDNTGNWLVGAFGWAIAGGLADFAIFGKALTGSQIDDIYNNGVEQFIVDVAEPQPQPQPQPQPVPQAPPPSGGVPEPATTSLLAIVTIALLRRRR